VTSASTTSGKSRLANGESDTAAYLSPQGLSRDCWPRLGEHVKAVFGAADVAEEKESIEEYETGSTEKKVSQREPLHRPHCMISASIACTQCFDPSSYLFLSSCHFLSSNVLISSHLTLFSSYALFLSFLFSSMSG
jgi:hypothetical protein